MDSIIHNFSTKEELAEWLVLNIKERFDQEELMFEGLKNLQECDVIYIKSRVIYLKLDKSVIDEEGNILYLEDYRNLDRIKIVLCKKEDPKSITTHYMPLWKWIKLQTPPEEIPFDDGLPF